MWKANSLRVRQKRFQGSQRLKLPFLGGLDKFSRAVLTVRASQGGVKFQRGHTWKIGFLRVIFGVTSWNSCFFRPKNKFRKLPSTPLYGQNAIAHLVTKLDMLFETQLFYPKILDFMQKHYSVSTIVNINLQ